MRIFRLTIFAAALLSASLLPARSAASLQGKAVEYILPDGSRTPLTIIGNENGFAYLTPDGFALSPDPRGNLYYLAPSGATVVPTKIRFLPGRKRTINEIRYLESLDRSEILRRVTSGAFATTTFTADSATAPLGEVEIPVLFVEFADKRFETPDPMARLAARLGISTGSLADTSTVAGHLYAGSAGRFVPRFRPVSPVVRLRRKLAYYGADRGMVADRRIGELSGDILEAMLPAARRRVEGSRLVAVVFAGESQDRGGCADALWSRAAEGNGSPRGFERYFTVGEHASSVDISSALLSAYGIPFPLDAPARMEARWLSPDQVRGPESVRLASGSALISLPVASAGSDRFMLSNENGTLATWRIDAATGETRRCDVFPASVAGFEIGDVTLCADGSLTFDIDGGGEAPAPTTALAPVAVEAGGFTARWQSTPAASAYLVEVFSGFDAIPVATVEVAAETTEAVIDGLSPDTDYSYTVRVVGGSGNRIVSAPSVPVGFTTSAPSMDMRRVEACGPDAVTADGFTARWFTVDDAESYRLSVYRKQSMASRTLMAGFDPSPAGLLPQGWNGSEALAAGDVAGYFGNSRPSLKMGRSGLWLASAPVDGEVDSIAFWCRGERTLGGARLIVEGEDVRGLFSELASVVPSDDEGLRFSIGRSRIPAGTVGIRLRLDLPDKKHSAVYVDDVALSYTLSSERIYVEGYDNRDVGLSPCEHVAGLDPSTVYYYTVSAVGDTAPDGRSDISAPSEEMMVVTAAPPRDIAEEVATSLSADVRLSVAPGGFTAENLSDSGREVVCTNLTGAIVIHRFLDPGERLDFLLPHNSIFIVRAGSNSLKLLR